MSSYRVALDNWLSELEVKAETVLDIGGSQLPVEGRTKSWDVEHYTIADLPQPHEGKAPDMEIDLNTDIAPKLKYDLIFCLEVFEYVYDPVNAMCIIKALLAEDGCAWVSFPSVYPLHQPVEDDALRYMPAGIKKLSEACGLKISDMIPRFTETDAIYNAFRTEKMRCAKHENHNISGWIVRFSK